MVSFQQTNTLSTYPLIPQDFPTGYVSLWGNPPAYRVDEGPNAARKRVRDTIAPLHTGNDVAHKYVQCPVTAPHGRGESHATVLRGAYLTRGGIKVRVTVASSRGPSRVTRVTAGPSGGGGVASSANHEYRSPAIPGN